jgi:hypothetical protein
MAKFSYNYSFLRDGMLKIYFEETITRSTDGRQGLEKSIST